MASRKDMTPADLVAASRAIARTYNGNLTVRQLYYRLVATGRIPNDQSEYKRLVDVLSDARLAGTFPFEYLLDRTREAKKGSYGTDQTDVAAALNNASEELRNAPNSWLWRSLWWGQRTYVSVWVEKEALAGVFEAPCEDLGVGTFVLRGYSSLSALSEWCEHLANVAAEQDTVERAVVLYFGDHDPDGWEIPRSAERNLHQIIRVRDLDIPDRMILSADETGEERDRVNIKFVRCALNMDQILQYNPPPFPAKMTSARYAGYVEEHDTTDAWELDALPPNVLDELIRKSVARYFDWSIRAENEFDVLSARQKMREEMRAEGWVANALGEE